MNIEDSNSDLHHHAAPAVPAVGGLRIVALKEPAVHQRRRTLRRRLFAAFLIERRRADRRAAKPGIDGLLRTVLSDDWK